MKNAQKSDEISYKGPDAQENKFQHQRRPSKDLKAREKKSSKPHKEKVPTLYTLQNANRNFKTSSLSNRDVELIPNAAGNTLVPSSHRIHFNNHLSMGTRPHEKYPEGF